VQATGAGAPRQVAAGVKPPEFEAKIREPAALESWIGTLARPLVFTNGVFDLLHRGHVTYLAQARALGAALLVALNSDRSARKLGKGADRPLNPLADRLAVLAALECVDAVTWFDDDTPEALVVSAHHDVAAHVDAGRLGAEAANRARDDEFAEALYGEGLERALLDPERLDLHPDRTVARHLDDAHRLGVALLGEGVGEQRSRVRHPPVVPRLGSVQVAEGDVVEPGEAVEADQVDAAREIEERAITLL